MNPEQRAAYMDLLCHAWNDPDCSIPADPEVIGCLARVGVRWEEIKARVLACFVPHPTKPGRLVNEKLSEVRKDQELTHRKRVQAGRKAGSSRALAGHKPATPESESESESESDLKRRADSHPRKDDSPEQPKTVVSVASVPAALRGLSRYETDRKLVGRFPALLEGWRRAFPGINLEHEIAKAHAWEESHPGRAKKDHLRFLNNWFSKAQDQASRTVRGTPFVPTVAEPGRTNCAHCGGTKEVAGGVENGQITRIPCRYCVESGAAEDLGMAERGGNLISETLGKAFKKVNR